MPLQKGWKPLNRSTVDSVPDRYGIYEIGDADGSVIAIDHGPLRDELKEVLAYGDGSQIRWRTTQNRTEAERLVDEHRTRLSDR
jgi:hypothetical protein